jgi:signal transduction histidine kinase/ligand-binding sensor domain-containing protein/DNA-binding response OmpR family regulator
MLKFITLFIVCCIWSISEISEANAINIERFEKFNTEDGLSQSTITSIYCDEKGFLWFGTMNGLNRFDGHSFKVFQSSVENPNLITNNRVISIWEDKLNFLWFKTYDGYYHCYNPRKETFLTLPKYLVNIEEKSSKINCFTQLTENEIWLGASKSGAYQLIYNQESDSYSINQFTDKGTSSISSNNVKFILSAPDSTLFIGNQHGLNIISHENRKSGKFHFQQYFPEISFTSAVAINDEIWIGTQNEGIIIYNTSSQSFNRLNKSNSPLTKNNITNINKISTGIIITCENVLNIYNYSLKEWKHFKFKAKTINRLYEDRWDILWVITNSSGVQKIDLHNNKIKHFDLIPPGHKYMSDKERPYFFEDSKDNLWICVHGGGLAFYDRTKDEFDFFYNDPNDPNSISSNTVMCMTEDHNNTLWVGTGLQGGVNRVVLQNPAFRSIPFKNNYTNQMENMVRAVFEDSNRNLWVASKGGEIKIFDKNYKEIKNNIHYPFKQQGIRIFNTYSIFQDSEGYIWLGSKGAGLAVSKTPVNNTLNDYSKIEFIVYQHNETDNSSLTHNNIYGIDEDINGNIWIATYGNGVSVANIQSGRASLTFKNYNTDNSNISNNLVRDVMSDTKGNIWLATTFGINMLPVKNLNAEKFTFKKFYRETANLHSLSYNDVVHMYEDTQGNIWFGTFGGGVNVLSDDSLFIHYTKHDGLCNNDVFGITEDSTESIWFSTEQGLSRFNPYLESFNNYTKSNSLGVNIFSENTCCVRRNGDLVFGGNNGFEVISPSLLQLERKSFDVVFTNFQLFNKNISVTSENSPLKNTITYSEKINLSHKQSSFSIEYSTLEYLGESRIQFAYILENFDKEWNLAGAQRKATYTNLPPGEYFFKVKAALWDGNWDENVSTLKINIEPPIWQTNIAYITYLIVFVVAIFFITRSIINIATYRTQLKIEKAVNEVKLKFFTNISHEIRTPLTLILNPIEDILADKSLPDKYRPSLKIMQKNGQRMIYLINQLLDFRKIQSNKMTLNIEKIDLVKFVKNITENFEMQAKHKNISFKFNSTVERIDIWGDYHKLDSAFFNILANAFKFTPPGKDISVNIKHHMSGKNIDIEIIDNGPGIKDEDIPLIFNRYTILSKDNLTEGTGIGLNFSNEIIKMHGGNISVKSKIGIGSTFIISLKTGSAHFVNKDNIVFKQNKNQQTNTQTSDFIEDNSPQLSAISMQNKGKPRILIVEDNQDIMNYITSSLSASAEILQAHDGNEGYKIATENNPDLIISDVIMPIIDGTEMTRKLKSNFETCHIPVILLTAKSSVDDQIIGIESGAEAYIVKPFKMQILISTIKNIINQRQLILKKYTPRNDIDVSQIEMSDRNKDFLNNIISYIEENYNNPELSISKIVEHSCVSRTVFYNKIKSLTGLSPIELLRQIKLKIAAQMLLNGYNVTETAHEIGFNDSRYFSKQFKEQFGKSPSEYKKQKQ